MVSTPGASLPRRSLPREFTGQGRSRLRAEMADWEPEIVGVINDKISRYPKTCSIRGVWPSDLALIVSYALDAAAVVFADEQVAS